MSYTKGPWFAIPPIKWAGGRWRIDNNPDAPWANFGEIAYVRQGNAYLVAAAPELLEALKAMLNDPCDTETCPHDDYQSCPAEMARLAIAKVEGRP